MRVGVPRLKSGEHVNFYQPAWIEAQLRTIGFEIIESIERDPYEGFEVATRRAYIRAHKPK